MQDQLKVKCQFQEAQLFARVKPTDLKSADSPQRETLENMLRVMGGKNTWLDVTLRSFVESGTRKFKMVETEFIAKMD